MIAGVNAVALQRPASATPNMTPMVDVVMCILIFFMLGSSFLAPELMLANHLPASAHGLANKTARNANLPPVRMLVRMARHGDETWVTAFDTQPMKLDAPDAVAANAQIQNLFARKAAELSPDAQVLISPAGEVPYQDLITIYDYCVGVKFGQVAFAL